MEVRTRHTDIDPRSCVIVYTDELVAMHKTGKIRLNFFLGGSQTNSSDIMFLTSEGVFSMDDGTRYTNKRIIVRSWLALSVVTNPIPLDWAAIDMKNVEFLF